MDRNCIPHFQALLDGKKIVNFADYLSYCLQAAAVAGNQAGAGAGSGHRMSSNPSGQRAVDDARLTSASLPLALPLHQVR
jgi:hypothetical protein